MDSITNRVLEIIETELETKLEVDCKMKLDT